jgi:hypothetical protein
MATANFWIDGHGVHLVLNLTLGESVSASTSWPVVRSTPLSVGYLRKSDHPHLARLNTLEHRQLEQIKLRQHDKYQSGNNYRIFS